MKFFTIATLLAVVAVAHPVEEANSVEVHRADEPDNGSTGTPNDWSQLCPEGLYRNPLCCDVFLLGFIGLDCNVPSGNINDSTEFQQECALTNDRPLCCVAPIAHQALLCQPASGV